MKQPARKIVKKVQDFAIEQLVPGATAIVKSTLDGGGDIVQSISNVIQRSTKEGLLKAFLGEWNELVEAGKADPNIKSTEIGQQCLQELMDSLDKQLPDKKRFDAMKALFFRAAAPDATEALQGRCAQLMKLCRQLDSTELTILSVAYAENQRRLQGPSERITSADQWPRALAHASSDLLSIGLIEHYEESMIEKRLIGDRQHNDRSGIRNSENFRLAPLGMELGKFLME